ncbi:hypothetical protein MUU74_04195 [Chryseobacterium daecheongense]|uniref:hypothetical protein n=1 Tax=Chryseobacterium daecheongense TaxID=192389 RepID=UPI001FD6A493|nr:hypothetical protein [Chryseobacterium daecheongense]UOU99161.1 hypothetical protein MUU74_04195 [Chryseobacterium daecheongense]
MAYDIGVVGIYAFPGPIAKKAGHNEPVFLILGPPDFVQVDNDTFMPLDINKPYDPIVNNSKIDSIGFNMATYNEDREKELKVTYRSTREIFGSGSGYLFVCQKFIMTRYSDKPAHEPTGGLKAARLFPITQLIYNTPTNSKYKIEDYVESFRVDYRLYINLDTYTIAKSRLNPNYNPTLVYDRVKSKNKIKNAAGLFKDEEDMRFWQGFNGGVANAIFYSTEKPIVAEVVSTGLDPHNKNILWDNIHWWGIDDFGVLGSTPGSFHAVHIHWRWAKGMQTKGGLATESGKPQFIGLGNRGELTDPNIKNQILRFAIIKNEGLPLNYHTHTSENFKDFFINLRKGKGGPQNLKKGGDIILYYSSEVKLKDIKKTSSNGLFCSIFVHGLFFAHDVEKSGIIESSKAGTTNSFYVKPKQPDNKKWERYPEK